MRTSMFPHRENPFGRRSGRTSRNAQGPAGALRDRRRVQIEDVTDQFSLFHALSQQSPTLENGRMVSVRRFAEPGWDRWGDATQHRVSLQELSSQWTLCDSEAAEVMRIEQGIPTGVAS